MIEVFFLSGALITLGFFATEFFRKTRIPDALILIFAGVLVGPILGLADTSPGSVISTLAPYVNTLALIILLFDGGLNLNIYRVVKKLHHATYFTGLVFTLTLLLTGLVAKYLLGWSLLDGFLLGAVIGGTCSSLVIPLTHKTSANEETETILNLEAAITDALTLVVSITIIHIILTKAVGLKDIASSIAGTFSTAIVVAVIFAYLWIAILRKFHGKALGYILTIAVVLMMFAAVEAMGGNGTVAVFVFGLMLGNFHEISRLLPHEENFQLDNNIRAFHVEVSFLIRTFLFIYIGLLLNPASFSIPVITSALGVLGAIFAARLTAVHSLVRLAPETHAHKQLVFAMMPRGLAAAVLSTLPRTMGLKIEHFPDIVFVILIATNVVATTVIFMHERKAHRKHKHK